MTAGRTLLSTRRLVGALALVGSVLIGAGPATAAPSSDLDPASLTPTRIVTVAESKCPPPTLSTQGIECRGWDGTDVRDLSDLWVVGYANIQEQGQKYVLQTVATFDLVGVKEQATTAKVAKASLAYTEVSTHRRSAAGDSEYGILPTCNTKLGVAAANWNGNQNKIVPSTQALTAGVAGATTGSEGVWDVTPQVAKWAKDGAGQGNFVFRSDDETLEPKTQQLCISYLIGIGLTVEFAPAE